MPNEDIEAGIFLKSLSPREELAEFLATRGFVCLAHNRLKLALGCFEKAAELSSRNWHFAKWRDYTIAKRQVLMRGDGFLNAPSPLDDDYPDGPFWVRTPQGQELLVQVPEPWTCNPSRQLNVGEAFVYQSVHMPNGKIAEVAFPLQVSQYHYEPYWLELSNGKLALVHRREKRLFSAMLSAIANGQPAIPAVGISAHVMTVVTAGELPSERAAIFAAIEQRRHQPSIGFDAIGQTLPGLLAGPASPHLRVGAAIRLNSSQ